MFFFFLKTRLDNEIIMRKDSDIRGSLAPFWITLRSKKEGQLWLKIMICSVFILVAGLTTDRKKTMPRFRDK